MGEIADMMLDGTMDPETGEFNFDGMDGPGWPMTGAEAAAYKRDRREFRKAYRAQVGPGDPAYKVTKKVRAKVEAFGELRQNDTYHWQVRKDGKVVADWWPHKSKWRIAGVQQRGNDADFIRALAKQAAA